MKHDRPRSLASEVTLVIARQLRRVPDDVPLDVTLSDLGADTLDRIELACALEERFGVVVPDSVIDASCTVADVILSLAPRPVMLIRAGREGYCPRCGVIESSCVCSMHRTVSPTAEAVHG